MTPFITYLTLRVKWIIEVSMTIFKRYLSNLSPVWPIKRQEAILDGLEGAEYRDEIPSDERRGFRINGLQNRAMMLRKSSRQTDQIIQVASVAAFARNAEDLMMALAQAAEVNATVRDISAKIDIKPSARAKDLKEVAKLFAESRKRAAEVVRGSTGGKKSAELRSAQSKSIALKYEKDWVEYKKTNRQISDESGLSVNTLKLYLGRRVEARARHFAMLKRKNNAYSKRGSAKDV